MAEMPELAAASLFCRTTCWVTDKVEQFMILPYGLTVGKLSWWPPPPIGLLRCTYSRALRAAIRAVAAKESQLCRQSFLSFLRMFLPDSVSPTAWFTAPLTRCSVWSWSVLRTVAPVTFTEITAISPSRKSSPDISTLLFPVSLLRYFSSTRVSCNGSPLQVAAQIFQGRWWWEASHMRENGEAYSNDVTSDISGFLYSSVNHTSMVEWV